MLRDATHYLEAGRARSLLMAPEDRGAQWCATVYWNNPGLPLMWPPDDHVSSRVAQARVYRGSWIVGCVCGGAQYACRTDHRLFCCDCGNSADGGAWLTVEWPAEAEEIERLLSLRTEEVTRNWFPGETLDALKAENAELGVDV